MKSTIICFTIVFLVGKLLFLDPVTAFSTPVRRRLLSKPIWTCESCKNQLGIALSIHNGDSRIPPEITVANDTTVLVETMLPNDAPAPVVVVTTKADESTRKRDMIKFALPALGLYLANPLLSNLDNIFVGKTAGVIGLATLSPATLCIDQILYLFTFLSRATTGLVARAYATGANRNQAAREAAAAPMTTAMIAGFAITLFYFVGTPLLLNILNVDTSLRAGATSYIHWRGLVTFAALMQSIALSILMVARDTLTPMKIIGISAMLNILGDAAFCVWPFKTGVMGAAIATAIATVYSSGAMLEALRKKDLLPTMRLPKKKEFLSLLKYTGPLLAVTLTRLGGIVSMQSAAMALGVKELAAYQININILIFFLLFGEPLSQLSQTRLPALVDRKDKPAVWANVKSIGTLAVMTSLAVGAVAFTAANWGSPLFSADPQVQLLAKGAAPSIFLATVASIFSVGVDGVMLASREFDFMLIVGLLSFMAQLGLLKVFGGSLEFIFGTFTMRLGVYSLCALVRAGMGRGTLGKALFAKSS